MLHIYSAKTTKSTSIAHLQPKQRQQNMSRRIPRYAIAIVSVHIFDIFLRENLLYNVLSALITSCSVSQKCPGFFCSPSSCHEYWVELDKKVISRRSWTPAAPFSCNLGTETLDPNPGSRALMKLNAAECTMHYAVCSVHCAEQQSALWKAMLVERWCAETRVCRG